MNARYRLASSIASSSDAASTSPQPETSQCIRAPPSASSVVFSPIAISTMRGLPTYREALPSTMITTSVSAGRYAEPAGDGPKRMQTCGTTPESWTSL